MGKVIYLSNKEVFHRLQRKFLKKRYKKKEISTYIYHYTNKRIERDLKDAIENYRVEDKIRGLW